LKRSWDWNEVGPLLVHKKKRTSLKRGGKGSSTSSRQRGSSKVEWKILQGKIENFIFEEIQGGGVWGSTGRKGALPHTSGGLYAVTKGRSTTLKGHGLA